MMPSPALSRPHDGSLDSEWLQQAIQAFHSGHRALPLRYNRLLEQLHAESEIVAGSARLLLKAMNLSDNESVLPHLQRCLETVRDMDQQLTASLCRTLITPIDAEDLKLLSAHSVRLVRQQARIARMIDVEGGATLCEAQQPVVEWAEGFARAVGVMPGRKAIEEAEQMRSVVRHALYLLRDKRCRMLAGNPEVRGLMRDLARIDVFEEVVEQMKTVQADVLGILIKWQ